MSACQHEGMLLAFGIIFDMRILKLEGSRSDMQVHSEVIIKTTMEGEIQEGADPVPTSFRKKRIGNIVLHQGAWKSFSLLFPARM